MASVIWMAVFLLLMVELFITLILVLPLPRVIRRFIAKKIFTYDLARRFRFASNFIILALILAVSDAISTLRHLEHKEESASENTTGAYSERVGYIGVSLDKQRKFRAERNMYLAGFALTLVFVIARIVELMQQVSNTEEEREALTQRIKDIGEAANAATTTTTDISSPPDESTLRKRTNATATNADKED